MSKLKPLDLSDLSEDQPKSLDLSDLGESATIPESEDNIQTLTDALLGASRGLTYSFPEEIYGLGKASLETLKGSEQPFSELYEQEKQTAAETIKQAEERSPSAFTAGEVAGAIASPINKLLAPIGAVGKIAPKVTDTFLPKVGKAASRGLLEGAAMGAITGAGKAESISDIPEDVLQEGLTGAGLGAALGGSLSTLGSAYKKGKEISKKVGDLANTLEAVEDYKAGKELIDKGVNVLTKKGREAGKALIAGHGETLGSLISQGFDEASNLYNKLTALTEAYGIKINSKDTIEELQNKINTLRQSPEPLGPQLTKDLNELDDLIKSYTSKTQEVVTQNKKIEKSIIDSFDVTDAKQREQLLKKQKLAQSKADQLGTGEKVHLVEGDDGVAHLIKTSSDEAAPIFNIKASARTTDEKAIGKLEDQLDKLNSQANYSGEGLEYRIIKTKDGFSHIVETSALPTTNQLNTSIIASSDLANKEGLRKLQNKLDELQFIAKRENNGKTYKVIQDKGKAYIEETSTKLTSETSKLTVPVETPSSLKGVSRVKSDLDLLTKIKEGKGATIESPEAKKLATEASLGLKEKLRSPETYSGLPQEQQGLAKKAAESWRAMEDVINQLNIPEEFIQKNAATLEPELTPQGRKALFQKFITEGAVSGSGIETGVAIKKVIDNLNVVNPKLGSEFKAIYDTASKYTGSLIATGLQGLTKASITKALPTLAGQFVAGTRNALDNITPAKAKAMAEATFGAGEKSAAWVKDYITKDEKGKKALLFSMLQNPSYREKMKPFLSSQQEKEEK